MPPIPSSLRQEKYSDDPEAGRKATEKFQELIELAKRSTLNPLLSRLRYLEKKVGFALGEHAIYIIVFHWQERTPAQAILEQEIQVVRDQGFPISAQYALFIIAMCAKEMTPARRDEIFTALLPQSG